MSQPPLNIANHVSLGLPHLLEMFHGNGMVHVNLPEGLTRSIAGIPMATLECSIEVNPCP
jgi:hypothetical protein